MEHFVVHSSSPPQRNSSPPQLKHPPRHPLGLTARMSTTKSLTSTGRGRDQGWVPSSRLGPPPPQQSASSTAQPTKRTTSGFTDYTLSPPDLSSIASSSRRDPVSPTKASRRPKPLPISREGSVRTENGRAIPITRTISSTSIGSANNDRGKRKGRISRVVSSGSESDDMPTPKGVRDAGVPIARQGKAYKAVHDILNGNGNGNGILSKTESLATPVQLTKKIKRAPSWDSSPDPIDSLSNSQASPTPSPPRERRPPLHQRDNVNSRAPSAVKKVSKGSEKKSTATNKAKSTATALTAERNSSIISVSSTRSRDDRDSESQPTPKATQRKSLPSFKKKTEKAYTPEEFQESQKTEELKNRIGKTSQDSLGRVSLTEEAVLRIKEERRRRLEEEAEKDDKEDDKLRKEKDKRKVESSAAAAFFAKAPALRSRSSFARVKSENDKILDTIGEATPTKSSSLTNLQLTPQLSAEERAREKYLDQFRDHSDPCPFCSEPLPLDPSPELEKMRVKLATVGRRTVGWTLTATFCGLHRAETSIIPLGLREKYLADIDFERLQDRLEEGFVRLRIRHVVDKPGDSRFFCRTQKTILTKGVSGWQAPSVQAQALCLGTPGYYGEIGKTVIMHHFQQLLQWGMLPTLTTDAVQPLSPADFLLNVLVPEAVTLLIMQDRGWRSTKCKGEEWKEARKVALAVRNESAKYGQWKFREDSELGARVNEQLTSDKYAASKRRLFDATDIGSKYRTRSNGSSKAPIDIDSCSDTGTADPSEFGDEDEQFWSQAVVTADASGGGGGGRAFKRHESRSSAYGGGWDDEFTHDALEELGRYE